MPNTKSAKKAWRQAERRRLRNKPIRTRTRTAVKAARKALTVTGKNAVATATPVVIAAQSALDRAVTKGVMHRNAAARRKSRLMRRLNQLAAASA